MRRGCKQSLLTTYSLKYLECTVVTFYVLFYYPSVPKKLGYAILKVLFWVTLIISRFLLCFMDLIYSLQFLFYTYNLYTKS